MKKLLPLLIGLSLGSVSLLSHAENLLQIYQQAKTTNPDLRQSAAVRDAAFEKINQSRGSLLPQLGLNSSYNSTHGFRSNEGQSTRTTAAALQLTQVVFNMATWKQLTITEKQAGVSDVTHQAAEQQLILTTATAYFNVLRAIDSLAYIQADKQAVYEQLDMVTQKFNVGLTATTDVQNAQAQYDQVLANEVAARNNLNNALEALRQITGIYYGELSTLDIKRFTTQPMQPIDPLLKEAESRNLTLLSARLNQDLAREEIRRAQDGHLPTVGLTASTGLSKINHSTNQSSANEETNQSSFGVNLNIPIYSGGTTSSLVKQAQLNFVAASEQIESTQRSVVNSLRTSYNNTRAAISSITALEQSVVSAQSSLDAMKAGYQVGTRTIVDVLTATTNLYNAKQNLSTARYNYLISLLTTKSALGTLNLEDLTKLNNILGASVTTQPEFDSVKTP